MDWRVWAYSVITCALSCSIVSQLVSDGKEKDILRLLCGILLAISILCPFTRVNPEELLKLSKWDLTEGEAYIAEGEKMAAQEKMDSIKTACETYILNKARTLGAEIQADISLDEWGIPVFAELQGKADANVRLQLETVLTTDLGIPKESQKWIWNQENNSS